VGVLGLGAWPPPPTPQPPIPNPQSLSLVSLNKIMKLKYKNNYLNIIK